MKKFQEYIKNKFKFPEYINTEFEKIGFINTGLQEEAGEVSGQIKRLFREGGLSDFRREKIVEEMGDTLAYYMALANIFDITIKEIVDYQIEKIEKKY